MEYRQPNNYQKLIIETLIRELSYLKYGLPKMDQISEIARRVEVELDEVVVYEAYRAREAMEIIMHLIHVNNGAPTNTRPSSTPGASN